MSKLRWTRKPEEGIAVLSDENGTLREFNVTDLPKKIRDELELYGLVQVLSDRTANVKDKAEKISRMEAVYDMLKTGQFYTERVATITKYKSILEQAKKLIAKGKTEEAQKLLSQI